MAIVNFSLDDEVCFKFVFYASVVLLKMMFMSIWTARHRIHKKFVFYVAVVLLKTLLMALWTGRHTPKLVYATPEDDKYMGKKNVALTTDTDVERVRRCHLNDLENVLPFVLVGCFYLLTGPELSTAVFIFRLFAGSRYFHTLAYLTPLPQPCRGLAFFAGYGATLYMLYKVLMATCPCL